MENNHLIKTQFGVMSVESIYRLVFELTELKRRNGDHGAGRVLESRMIQYFMDVLDANGY